MLTNHEIVRMRNKILSARAFLMREHPFFGILLMHLRFVALEDMEQISTNGFTVFVSSEWMKWYSMNELACLLCHQIIHILMGDICRPLSLMGDEYHYERDVDVNKMLAYLGVGNYYVYIRSVLCPKDEEQDEDDEEEQKPKTRTMVDTDLFWSDRTDYVENGVLILDASVDTEGRIGFVESQSSDEALMSYWQNTAMSCGLETGEKFEQELLYWKNKEKGKLNWKKLLREFTQEEMFDYSFCPPDKRLGESELFLPDFNDTDVAVRNLLFMVDTSGSVDEEMLNEVYSEIKSAIEQFSGKVEGMIGFFDSDVVEPVPFSSEEDLGDIEAYGGGGTDFAPIFEYVRKECKNEMPSGIIIFTDGYGHLPDEDFDDVPVLWMITVDDLFEPPFGRVAYTNDVEATFEKT